MEYKENAELCHCKHVTLADIDRALAQTNRFSDVEREFQEVQKITSCSTGCGGQSEKVESDRQADPHGAGAAGREAQGR